MTHDPETRTVEVTMVSGAADGTLTTYRAVGTYREAEHQPLAELVLSNDPVEVPSLGPFREFRPGTPEASASCRFGPIELTEPATRVRKPPEEKLGG